MAQLSWMLSSTPYYATSTVNEKLQNNPVEFFLVEGQPEFEEYKMNDLSKKVVFRRRTGDPRLVRHHKFQVTYPKMDRDAFEVLNNFTSFWGQTIYLKLWIFAARYDPTLTTSKYAAVCHPKGDGHYDEYFCPYRNLSDDTDDTTKTKVWVDGVLADSDDYTIDYVDGKITFDTELTVTNKVQMHFVWRPAVTILSLDPRPNAGYSSDQMKYSPVVVFQEV